MSLIHITVITFLIKKKNKQLELIEDAFETLLHRDWIQICPLINSSCFFLCVTDQICWWSQYLWRCFLFLFRHSRKCYMLPRIRRHLPKVRCLSLHMHTLMHMHILRRTHQSPRACLGIPRITDLHLLKIVRNHCCHSRLRAVTKPNEPGFSNSRAPFLISPEASFAFCKTSSVLID